MAAPRDTSFYVDPSKRSIVLPGLPADRFYSLSVRGYRRVDKDIDASGVIYSPTALAKSWRYQPSVTVSFSGDITGTIQGVVSTQVIADLNGITSDNILSRGEKPQLLTLYNQISASYTASVAKAAQFGGLDSQRAALVAAKQALDGFLTGLSQGGAKPAWNDLTGDTPINQTNFQAAFASVAAKQADLDALLVDVAWSRAGTAIASVAALAADNILSKGGEKQRAALDYKQIDDTVSALNVQWLALGSPTDVQGVIVTAISKRGELYAYLDSLDQSGAYPEWNSQAGDTPFVAATWTQKWGDAINAAATASAAITGRKGEKGDKGQDGTSAYAYLLTNEAHILPADATGAVTTYNGATTKATIFANGSDQSAAFNLSVAANPQALVYSIDQAAKTITVTGGLDVGEPNAVMTLRMTGSGAYAGTQLDRQFSLTKSRAGADGTPAALISLRASTSVAKYNASGVYVGGNIVFTATRQNTTAPTKWIFRRTADGAVLVGPNTAAELEAYNSAAFGNNGPDSIVYKAAGVDDGVTNIGGVTVEAFVGSTFISDSITITKVQDGAKGADGVSALVGYLTNESHTLAADANGNPVTLSGASGHFKVFLGTTDVTDQCTFSGGAYSPADLPGSLPSSGPNGGQYAIVGNWSGDTAWWDLVATYMGKTITKRFTVSKVRPGANGSSASVTTITSSSQQARYDKDNNYVGGAITFKAAKQNSGAAVTVWRLRNVNGATIAQDVMPGFAASIGYGSSSPDGDTFVMSSAAVAAYIGGHGGTPGTFSIGAVASGWSNWDDVSIQKLRDGSPGSAGTSSFNLASRGNAVVVGNVIEKVGGVEAWDSDAYSTVGYRDGAIASFNPASGSEYLMAGLNQDPTSNASHDSLDFAWYLYPTGPAIIYENGEEKLTAFVGYGSGQNFRVEYDGEYVRYYVNQFGPYREVYVGPGKTYHFDSSFASAGTKITNVGFASAGKKGSSPYQLLLTNEAHTVAADPAGNVLSYGGASTSLRVFYGAQDVTAQFNGNAGVADNPQGISVVGAFPTYSVNGGFDTGEDTATITFRVTGNPGTPHAGVTLDKVMSLSKSKGGANAPLLTIEASSVVLKLNADGSIPAGTPDFVFTAKRVNYTGGVNFEYLPGHGTNGGESVTDGGLMFHVPAARMRDMLIYDETNGHGPVLQVKVTGGGLSDVVTVNLVRDGAKGESAASIKISASKQTANYNSTGGYVGGAISFDVVRQNVTGMWGFRVIRASSGEILAAGWASDFVSAFGTGQYNSTGLSNLSITPNIVDYLIATYGSFIVQAYSDGYTVTDQVTITKVQDGGRGEKGDTGAAGSSAAAYGSIPGGIIDYGVEQVRTVEVTGSYYVGDPANDVQVYVYARLSNGASYLVAGSGGSGTINFAGSWTNYTGTTQLVNFDVVVNSSNGGFSNVDNGYGIIRVE